MPQSDVIALYRKSDLFVLPCRVAADGDRDGLPNVLVEAQSQGLACVSTPVSGVPELITDGENGLLVPPDEPEALSRALQDMIGAPELRARLGRDGEQKVRTGFSYEGGIDALMDLFRDGLPEESALKSDAA